MKKICELLLPIFTLSLLLWIMLGLLNLERIGNEWQLLGVLLAIVTFLSLCLVIYLNRNHQ